MTNKKSKTKAKPKKAWQGRFTQGPDPLAEAFSTSINVDMRLLPYDIMGSHAHSEMLAHTGIITKQERSRIKKGLDQIYKQWEAGKIKVLPQDEDVHMLVERLLYDHIGSLAGKLHTARSRNDQVITDFKLYLRVEVSCLIYALEQVQLGLVNSADRHFGWIMPGYTHMQVAQPVLVSHWLLAHVEAFYRDQKRFAAMLESSLAECPLGAAAMGGTSHPIDREMTAELLGFSKITANSMDTVSDRDFAVEFLSAAMLTGIHLSRLAEELVYFSSSEFKFITMDQGFSTGSSIMPQKRNPDIAELIRGRVGRLNGNLQTMLMTLKGLPLTYNRDLQEDKEPVFNSGDNLVEMLSVLQPMLNTLKFNQERMEQACQQGFPTATEAADHLVRQGLPFREAHEVVGKAVNQAAEQGITLDEFDLADWKKFHPKFQKSIKTDVSLMQTIKSKTSLGGTAPDLVKKNIKQHLKRLNSKKGSEKGNK